MILTLQDNGLGGLVLGPGPNLNYLAGFQGKPTERLLLAIYNEDGNCVLIVPRLDEENASKTASVREVYGYGDDEGPARSIRDALKALGIGGKVLGIEGGVPFRAVNALQKVSEQIRVEDVSEMLLTAREIKDETELRWTKKACDILSKTFSKLEILVSPGMTEKLTSTRVVSELISRGADDASCIVLSGPNASMPHLPSTTRKIRRRDTVVVDAWCTSGDYFGDVTRTLFFGTPSTKEVEVYNIILDANAAGLESIRSGVRAEMIDRAARSVVRSGGYGNYFIHRTGHGLGLEIHEAPYIREGNREQIKRGMVFTVEPGVYLPKRFGIRIEDDVLMGNHGAEVLTDISRELKIIK